MKYRDKTIGIISLGVFSMLVLIYGCKKNNNDDEQEPKDVVETIYTNPSDLRLYTLESRGRKAVFSGIKNDSGIAQRVTQIVIDAEDLNPDNRVLVEFDSNQVMKRISSVAYGALEFDYINDTTVIMVFTSPDGQDITQVYLNPGKLDEKSGGCGCEKLKKLAMLKKTNKAGIYHEKSVSFSSNPRSSPGYEIQSPSLKGSIETKYDPGNDYVPGTTVFANYQYPDGRSGQLTVEKLSPDGYYRYSPPTEPASNDGISISKAISILKMVVCSPGIPVGIYAAQICAALVAPPAIGTCLALVTAYVWACRLNTAVTVKSFVEDYFSAQEATYTFTALHPCYEKQVENRQYNPINPFPPNVVFYYEPYPIITKLYIDPPNPQWAAGYDIWIEVNKGFSGTARILIKVQGTCGYSDTREVEVVSGTLFQTPMWPGSLSDTDDITVKIITGQPPLPGQVKSRRIYLKT